MGAEPLGEAYGDNVNTAATASWRGERLGFGLQDDVLRAGVRAGGFNYLLNLQPRTTATSGVELAVQPPGHGVEGYLVQSYDPRRPPFGIGWDGRPSVEYLRPSISERPDLPSANGRLPWPDI
jgi:hypothetical protein